MNGIPWFASRAFGLARASLAGFDRRLAIGVFDRFRRAT